MQPGDLMMYDGEILCLVLEVGADFYGSKRVRFLMEDKVSEALDLRWVESNSEVLDGVE